FFSMNRNGSNPFTSPAMRAGKPVASNFVTCPTPLRPAQSASQLTEVPMPRGETRPIPVITTRLFNRPPLLLALGVRIDIVDGFLDARDLFGVFVGDLDAELLFEGHDELHRVE